MTPPGRQCLRASGDNRCGRRASAASVRRASTGTMVTVTQPASAQRRDRRGPGRPHAVRLPQRRSNRAPGAAQRPSAADGDAQKAAPARSSDRLRRYVSCALAASLRASGAGSSSEGYARGFEDFAEDGFGLRRFFLRGGVARVDHHAMREDRQSQLLEVVGQADSRALR